MKPFEYANPETETEALDLLNDHRAETAVLAGGTDLIGLMQRDLLSPKRVVDIKNVRSMHGISRADDGVLVGTLTTLEEALESPLLAGHCSLMDVIDGHRAIQIQQMGTIGGDLCHLPNCWFFRNGYGLLATQNGQSLVAEGDNRYHAILGNRGPAKFVSASRFAPAMIAWSARVRIIGPGPQDEEWLPLEYFYVTPKTARQGITALKPGQLISHVWLPEPQNTRSAAYEVLQSRGLDRPLASAAACLDVEGGTVRAARIAMGHVAPVPWLARDASQAIVGRQMNEETARLAGDAAVAAATPLSGNEYKVTIAATAVKRAVLRAADMLEGGL